MISQDKEDLEPKGAIPELSGIVGAEELLAKVKHRVQHVWIRVYSLELITSELPLIYAKWEVDDHRQRFGELPLFINSWLMNSMKNNGKNETRLAPKAHGKQRRYLETGQPCQTAFFDGKPVGCAVHKSSEACVIESRENKS